LPATRQDDAADGPLAALPQGVVEYLEGPPCGQTVRNQIQAPPGEQDRVDLLRLDEPLQVCRTKF
jgi:hypothetical protein